MENKRQAMIYVYGGGLLPTSAYTSFVEFPFQYIEGYICLQYKEGFFPPTFL